jgi:hypothetical protein
MVLKVLRWFTVLILALAVPLQGLAAVTGGLCMAMGHHGQTAGHSHGIEHVQTENSGDVQGLHHTHSSTGHTDHSSGKAYCAPCVACCAATAIAPSALLFVPDELPASAPAAASASFTGVSPHQLDRPPLAL